MITSSFILFNLRQRTEECMRTAKIGPNLRLIIIKLLLLLLLLLLLSLLYVILKGCFSVLKDFDQS